MYCPACDKEFSPVHSRCPECKGWLRVSGPPAGTKAASAAGAPPIARPTSATVTAADPLPSRASGTLMGNNVPLPSRPTARPNVAPAPPAPTPRATSPGDNWSEPAESPAPKIQGQLNAPSPADAASGRGALGTGWESSGSFAAPNASWGASNANPPASTGGWGSAAPPASSAPVAGWGGGQTAPSGIGGQWGAPAPEAKVPGWGNSGGLGPAPGVAPAAPLGGAPALGQTPGGGFAQTPSAGQSPGNGQGLGGGWLGDGGGGSASTYTPPARSGGWLGDSGSSEEPAAATMPAMSPQEIAATSESPVLSLPDHTVAVDLGTPWEDELPGTSSNKWVYWVLGGLLCALLSFFGYTYWTRKSLEKPAKVVAVESSASSLDAGLEILAQAKKSFQAKKFQDAQAGAETAHTLIAGLSVAPPARVKEVKNFYRQTTLRCASDSYSQAERAISAGEFNQALGLCDQAVKYYSKLNGTQKEQGRAVALKGKIYLRLKDYPNAEIAFKKAMKLSPGGGYQTLANQARGAQSNLVAPQQPAVTAAQQPSTTVQPSIDGGASYPSGSYPTGTSGGYRPSPGGAAAPPPAAAGVRKQPVNTYVPPKRDSTPSWRKKPSDRLPTY